MFFSFLAVFPLPKWPKILFQYPLALRYPKILEKSRKHHQGLVSVRNRLWAPPPPAKADIATAILTNVIEHLVLLLPPNKHAFTAKAVWADFQRVSTLQRDSWKKKIFGVPWDPPVYRDYGCMHFRLDTAFCRGQNSPFQSCNCKVVGPRVHPLLKGG